MVQFTLKLPQLTRRRAALTAAGLAAATTLAAGTIIYLHAHTALIGLPTTSYRNLAFPVYYPHPIPAGFQLDAHSISSTAQVLTYKFTYQAETPVLVSIQPLDPALDTGSFRPTREITTPIGHGYLVEYEERTTIAVLAPQALVLINAPQQIPGAAIEQFAASLRRVK